VIIEPFLTDQWYVDAKTMAQPAIAAVENGDMVFEPRNWEKTYFEWMRNIEPWCVSRQLWWGHRIPAWYDDEGNVYVEETEEGPRPPPATRPSVRTRTSSTPGSPRPVAVLDHGLAGEDRGPGAFYPTHTLVTSFDIIFFWVARMMMMGLHFTGEVPFKRCSSTPWCATPRAKMSKSKGNVVDPLGLVDKYGCRRPALHPDGDERPGARHQAVQAAH
jgi:valyl-tRNA synthetase